MTDIHRKPEVRTIRQTDRRETERHRDAEIDSLKVRQIHRQAEKQAIRQTGIETDRQTDRKCRKTERKRDR